MNLPRYGAWSRAGTAALRSTIDTTVAGNIYALTTSAANFPISGGPPDNTYVWLDSITFELSNIAAGPASTITFFLARDAAGDRPITPQTTTTLVLGATTPATRRGVSVLIERPYVNELVATIDVSETIYCVATVDAGTADIDIRLNWRA